MTTPKSGWSWGDPLPQGSTIRVLTFTSSRGYAAGDFGTVLRTDDGGATWTGLRTGVTADLTDLTLITPDSLVVGGGCVLRRSDDGGRTFQRLPFTPTDERCSSPLAATAFPSPAVGYVVTADGSVLRSDDGGKTFGRRTAVPETHAVGGPAEPTAIVFTTADDGIAATSSGKLLSTSDGANSWVVRASVPARINNVAVVGPSTIYAVGDGSSLLVSADGGQTWTTRPLAGAPGGLSLTGISCTGVDVCVISTRSGDRLLRTTDGGATASSVTPSTSPVFAAAFAAATRVVAAGQAGATVLSDDAGVTFTPVGRSLDGVYSRVRAGQGALWADRQRRAARPQHRRRARRGRTSASPRRRTCATSRSRPPRPATRSTTAGTVLRSDNGGSSWRLLDTGSTRRPNALASPSANVVLLFGPRGILRSGDGGNQFDEVTASAVRRASAVQLRPRRQRAVRVRPEDARALGRRRAALDEAAAAHARHDRSSTPTSSRANSGWLLARGGRLYSTRNGGRRWTESLALGDSRGAGHLVRLRDARAS